QVHRAYLVPKPLVTNRVIASLTDRAAGAIVPLELGGAMQLKIRDARDDDAERLIDLIEGCYSEYAGCVLAVDEEAPELRAIASNHAHRRGRFWVAESNGHLVGCAGLVPADQ